MGDSIVIAHKEILKEIVGSVAFAATKTEINAGIAATFPWLSSMATGYEFYRFLKLAFTYVPHVPTTATGTVGLVTDFDAADAAPTSMINALSASNCSSGPTWQKQVSKLTNANLSHMFKDRTVRSNAIAANLDIKTYDTGNLFVCTQGQADASAVGYIYAEYEVKLSAPQKHQAF